MRDQRDTVTVAGVSGSLRQGSYTAAAVRLALNGAAAFGVRIRFLDLRHYDLPLHEGLSDAPGIAQWRRDVGTAEGLILGTPEYHGSFSGVLKNALDFLDFEQMEGKMIGLVGVSGGAMGAFDAMNSLRTVGRALHSWVVPQQAAIPEAWNVFDESGAIRDPQIERRLLDVGEQVARFAYIHKCGEVGDFLKTWEKAPRNPGASLERTPVS